MIYPNTDSKSAVKILRSIFIIYLTGVQLRETKPLVFGIFCFHENRFYKDC